MAEALLVDTESPLQLLPQNCRVLSLDSATKITGWGVVEPADIGYRKVASGVIRQRSLSRPEFFVALEEQMLALIDAYQPAIIVIEGAYTDPREGKKNPYTFGALKEVHAIIKLAAQKRGLLVYEYTPATIKLALTGLRQADKEIVAEFVSLHLGIDSQEPWWETFDETDALAVGLCYLMRGPIAGSKANKQLFDAIKKQAAPRRSGAKQRTTRPRAARKAAAADGPPLG